MAPLLLVAGVVLVFLGLNPVLYRQLRSQGHRASQPPPRRRIAHRFDPARSTRLTGGTRVGRWNATWPLVKLEVDPDWVRLDLGLLARAPGGLGGETWIPRTDVVAVRRVRSAMGSGIRFDSASGSFDRVIFWTFRVDAALFELARWGWPSVPS